MESVWLTSISFSSPAGGKSILAAGRSDGSLVIKSTWDGLPRFEVRQPYPIACLVWRPTCTLRPSKNPMNPGVPVQTEELLVGDERGVLYYYAVEWPMGWEVSRDTWPGSLTLMAKISVHSQQICGLAWSPDGKLLASGGNDNLCCLFDASKILDTRHNVARETIREQHPSPQGLSAHEDGGETAGSQSIFDVPRADLDHILESAAVPGMENRSSRASIGEIRTLDAGCERHRWVHNAAVKAIAFCPWRDGLVATGGGSNDKCIHFFHTSSGSALATISVAAQVTSLIWSRTRRELAATFGYAQPEHPYRIAIFSWPECSQVAAIP